MSILDEIKHLSQNLEKKVSHIKNQPDRFLQKYSLDIQEAEQLISDTPDQKLDIFIHIVGIPRSMKSSYVLDLYDNEELRDHLSIPEDSDNDHTACPCIIYPTQDLKSIKIRKVLFSDFSSVEITNKQSFNKLYTVSEEYSNESYLIRIDLPEDQCKFKYPVIEYPGIEGVAHGAEEKQVFYEKVKRETIKCMKKHPGILLACFRNTKLGIHENHPISIFIENYKNILNQKRKTRKLPLVISYNGRGAIRTSCSNNTDLVKLLNDDFKKHNDFDTKIQLINPNNSNEDYQIKLKSLDENNRENINDWISRFSQYNSYEDLKTEVEKDGGLAYSRRFLSELLNSNNITESIALFFHADWLEGARKKINAFEEIEETISKWNDIKNIEKHVKEMVLQYASQQYKTAKELYIQNPPKLTPEDNPINDAQNITNYWQDIIIKYYEQFIPSEDTKLLENREEAKKNLKKEASYIYSEFAKVYFDNKAWNNIRAFSEKAEANQLIADILSTYLANRLLRRDKYLMLSLLGIDFTTREDHG